MGKVSFKPGNMLYPLPAVMVSTADREGNSNILTVSWTGTLCTNPPMAYICVRPERRSYSMIMETREFVINVTTQQLARATDYCGVKSGRDVDKFKEMRLTKEKAQKVKAPLIGECPVNIECRVKETKNLGSHTMFIAEIVAVNVDDKYMNKTGKFDLNASELLVYSHGEYFGLGKKIGKFGYSVDKKYVNRDSIPSNRDNYGKKASEQRRTENYKTNGGRKFENHKPDGDRKFENHKTDGDKKFVKYKTDGDRKFENHKPDGDRKFENHKPDGDRKFENHKTDGDRKFVKYKTDGDRKFENHKTDGDRKFENHKPDGDRKFENHKPDGDKKFVKNKTTKKKSTYKKKFGK